MHKQYIMSEWLRICKFPQPIRRLDNMLDGSWVVVLDAPMGIVNWILPYIGTKILAMRDDDFSTGTLIQIIPPTHMWGGLSDDMYQGILYGHENTTA